MVIREFGFVKLGSKVGEFNNPLGLTVDNKYVYVCDHYNHRIQLLTKETGIYFSQWGNETEDTEQLQFCFPRSIYNHLSEDLIYVGDLGSVQLFRKDSVYLQRLESPSVSGICVMDDRLYVCDCNNNRIQIYERSMS